MNEKKKARFDVYLLDMYPDESGWIENERSLLGKLEVGLPTENEINDVEILSALKKSSYRDCMGRQINFLSTTDRRTVYAEDYYGDGSWWEVGTVKGRRPVYGLRLRNGEQV